MYCFEFNNHCTCIAVNDKNSICFGRNSDFLGLNAGMLVRYLLEKCKTTNEALAVLKSIPIASQQTLTIADREGNIVVVECNCEEM